MLIWLSVGQARDVTSMYLTCTDSENQSAQARPIGEVSCDTACDKGASCAHQWQLVYLSAALLQRTRLLERHFC